MAGAGLLKGMLEFGYMGRRGKTSIYLSASDNVKLMKEDSEAHHLEALLASSALILYLTHHHPPERDKRRRTGVPDDDMVSPLGPLTGASREISQG